MQGTIIDFIWVIYKIYFYMIFGYVILSWLPNARTSYIGQMLGKLVEPYLAPFRRFIPVIGGVIDISPIVALFALYYVFKGIEAVLLFFIR